MQRDLSRGQMKLGAFFHPTGHHIASWLHPDAQIDAGANFRHYVELAQMSERAKFDFMFLADALAVRDGNLEALSRWPQYMAYFEPITLLAGIAGQTEHIGLVATATTSYNEPYNVARKFASLDHISAGRAGWNVVTSANLSEAFTVISAARLTTSTANDIIARWNSPFAACGTVGTTTRFCATALRDVTSIRRSCIRLITRASISLCADRSMSHGRHRVIR